jgi:hypothetical protein
VQVELEREAGLELGRGARGLATQNPTNVSSIVDHAAQDDLCPERPSTTDDRRPTTDDRRPTTMKRDDVTT